MSARDAFDDLVPRGPWLLAGLDRSRLQQAAETGLTALAALWFDEYDDATELPAWLTEAYLNATGWLLNDPIERYEVALADQETNA